MAVCVCVYVFQELTRPETKAVKAQFAQTVAGKPTLRKCARNFIRYCDEDRSSKISLAEWSECLKLPGKAIYVSMILSTGIDLHSALRGDRASCRM